MKKVIMIGLVAAAGFGLYGCNQNQQSIEPDSAVVDASAARLATALTGGGGGRVRLTKVDVSTLPANALSHIAGVYPGSEIKHAGKDANGNLVVMITTATSEPKALLFNANGDYQQELTFERRGGGPKGDMTKVDVATLPSVVTDYVKTNHASAEIKGAAKDKDGNFVVMLVQDNVPTALLFDANGGFKQVLERRGGPRGGGKGGKRGDWTEVAAADLLQPTKDYISANYATGQIKRAAKSKTDGKYTVLLRTTDGQHVALLFAADGTFEKALTKK